MIEKGKLYNFFKSEFNIKKSTNGWYRFQNPYDLKHSDNSMGVNFNHMSINDFRNKVKVNLVTWLKAYKNLDYQTLKDKLESFSVSMPVFDNGKFVNIKAELPKHYKSLIYENTVLADRARRYLTDRGFDIEHLDSKGFGFVDKGDYMGYIIIPIVCDYRFRTFIGRDFIGNYLRYKNPEGAGLKQYFYNHDAINYETVGLCEGWADAETVGPSGIASLSVHISDAQMSCLLKSNCKTIYYFSDSGFEAVGVNQMIQLIDHKDVYIVSLGHLGKDLNAIGKEKGREAIKEATKLTYENYMQWIVK